MPDGNAFEQVCEPDGEGDTRAVLFPGDVDERMRCRADTTTFRLSCVSGVQAKCLRWVYQPWRTAPLTGESLTRHFNACIRLARADYCGDDQPSTRDGTMIDIYDRIGAQEPEYNSGALAFEAGWTENGTVCVHPTRIPENLDLATLSLQCPRLTYATLGVECDEITAMAEGALLFNRSVAKRQPWPRKRAGARPPSLQKHERCRVVMADATACITTHGMAGCQQPWRANPPPATAMAKQRGGSQASHDTDEMVPAVSSRIRGSLAASPCPRNRCRRSDRVSIPRGPC